MVQNQLGKQALSLVYPIVKNSEFKKYCTLTYFGKSTDIICKQFKDYNISFKNDNKLGKYIKNNKSKTAKFEKSSVYKLKCACEKV